VTLACVADGLRTATWLAASLQPHDNAAVITESGDLVTLPDRPSGPQLEAGSALVDAVVAVLRCGGGADRFLWQDGAGLWHRVRLHPLAGGALVTESPCPRPLNLTARELDVLTLLAAGRSNPEIAEALTIAVKTASKHVEHVLEKLGCASRAAAAARAVQDGLICLPGA
jgi:DNA-binding CsgD family transcriptional regulator